MALSGSAGQKHLKLTGAFYIWLARYCAALTHVMFCVFMVLSVLVVACIHCRVWVTDDQGANWRQIHAGLIDVVIDDDGQAIHEFATITALLVGVPRH